jgi:hypothetical protein
LEDIVNSCCNSDHRSHYFAYPAGVNGPWCDLKNTCGNSLYSKSSLVEIEKGIISFMAIFQKKCNSFAAEMETLTSYRQLKVKAYKMHS